MSRSGNHFGEETFRHHTYSILLEILERLRSPVQVGKATGGLLSQPVGDRGSVQT